MAALDRWNDDRLDDLSREVQRLIPAAESVGVLIERIKGLTEAVQTHQTTVNGQIKGMRDEIKNIVGDPIQEARSRRTALFVGVASALVGVGGTLIGIAVSGGVH